MDVGDEAEAKRAVGVVEDQAVALALGNAQAAADDLRVQDLGLRRPGQDDAADVPVDAGRQAVDVADDLDLAFAEPPADPLALVGGRIGVDIAGRHAGGLELVGELAGMSAVDGEAERRTIFAKAQPGRDRVGDQHRLAHGFRELALMEVAGDDLHARQIGMSRSEDPERRQEALSISSPVVAATMRWS